MIQNKDFDYFLWFPGISGWFVASGLAHLRLASWAGMELESFSSGLIIFQQASTSLFTRGWENSWNDRSNCTRVYVFGCAPSL